ncbi:hypothetical protein CROQUDRAFT_665373 [Cronartium quercuum f. sp. fusiforme G11]|uniref:Uncharacterized protein n=1 Tax=Cronartium quercuum f. sp. fusiforme G11 TaxID=708437 RepID=A0A9P6N9P9_9BASI|nr:hypothetical protein CROQUDRAFT_665373 [Cronartium quercuum f. sp. fusiforme G11]
MLLKIPTVLAFYLMISEKLLVEYIIRAVLKKSDEKTCQGSGNTGRCCIYNQTITTIVLMINTLIRFFIIKRNCNEK